MLSIRAPAFRCPAWSRRSSSRAQLQTINTCGSSAAVPLPRLPLLAPPLIPSAAVPTRPYNPQGTSRKTAHRCRLPAPCFKVSPTETELRQLAARLRRRRAKQQQRQSQEQQQEEEGLHHDGREREHREREHLSSGGRWGRWVRVALAASRWLWWAYLEWICTRWLTMSVYGMHLRALSSCHPPAGVLVVANHISQLDPAVMTLALRALGVDEVVILGEKDMAATLTASLMGNVLPILPVDMGEAGETGNPGNPSASRDPVVVAAGSGVEQLVAREVREALLGAAAGLTASNSSHGTVSASGTVRVSGASSVRSPGQSSCADPISGASAGRARRAVVVFPERGVGGREGSLRPWRLSVAALAAGLGCPVIPAFVSGTQRCLPQHFSIPSRGRVAVELGLPLPPPPPPPTGPPRHVGALAPGAAQAPDPMYGRRLAVYDSRVRDSMALLRALARARRAGGWRARPRNRRPAAGAGPVAHVGHALWLTWGWVSVAGAAVFMVAARLLDCFKVAVLLVLGELRRLSEAAAGAMRHR